jgi:heme-degrading monooxygenase HmoA
LLAEANDADALVLVSEWATRDALETFLTSREFTVLQGMRILLRKDPETVLDEVVGRATVPLLRAHAKT